MNTVPLCEIFNIGYGNSLTLSDLIASKSGVAFVSRTEKNNGVSTTVSLIKSIKPNPKNTISVAVGGSVMSSFLQEKPYYTGHHILILQPRTNLTNNEMLYYCMCLKANKYRYSYGRQANKTLNDLLVPAVTSIPKWVNSTKITPPNQAPVLNKQLSLNTSQWQNFKIGDLLELESCKCSNARQLLEAGDDIFYIGAKKSNNGVMNRVKFNESLHTKGNCLIFICDGQGSIGYSNYIEMDFIGSTTLSVGYNASLNKYTGLFLVAVLDLERPKYSFGRKYKKHLKSTNIKLPAKKNTAEEFEPDWQFMEDYIKSLPYSSSL